MNFLLHVTCSCIPHAYVLSIQYILIYLNCLGFFWLSLSLPLFFLFTFVVSMAPKCKSTLSQNPLHSRASSSPNPTPSHIRFRDKDARKAFSENFLDEAFILNTESFWWTSLTLIYPMSFTVGVGSHRVTSRSHVHSCWSRSFTPTCMDLIFQYLSFILAFKVRALLSHRSWSSMCCVPRVEFLDYPGCECLRTMSKDELKSTFCERPSNWGERQFTYYSDFAKGPQFLNMVMTFVLHPLSHYNY